MKIALLNFPFDNNYGGNLQRYALMRVLEDMGHCPEHLYTRLYFYVPNAYRILRRIIGSILRGRGFSNVCGELWEKIDYERKNRVMRKFYDHYVRHTAVIDHPSKLKDYQHYDAYIVGSDQVWRKDMSWKFPFPTMFFSWLERDDVKRIAYGVSFGIENRVLNAEDLRLLTPLYKKFDAVSVREQSGLEILDDYGWISPKAIKVLDPTLLLDRKVYEEIVEKGDTNTPNGNMLCYVLDMDDHKQSVIDKIAEEKGLAPYTLGINGNTAPSVEQWLHSFITAEYVVTDSYHGCVFSIIFNKPFRLMANKRRGMTRFQSLFNTLGVDEKNQRFDWTAINANIVKQKEISISFLSNVLT